MTIIKHMNKKNIILAIILVVLVGGAYLYQNQYKNWRIDKKKTENFFASVKVDDASKIEVTSAGKTVTMEKNGDKWKIVGTKDFYADINSVTVLSDNLKALAKAKIEVASENKDKKQDFETGDNGSTVKLWQGDKEIGSLVIGKLAPDYNSAYFSSVNSDKTYLAPIGLSVYMDPLGWYDKTIFKSAKEKITKLRFQFSNNQYMIEKKNDKWTSTTPKGINIKEEKITEILDIMSNLSAVSIPEQKFAGTGLEKSTIIVQANGDGVDNTIMIGNKSKDGNYYVKKGDSDNIYLISSTQRDSLNKKVTDLK
jgi:hypothetical protein